MQWLFSLFIPFRLVHFALCDHRFDVDVASSQLLSFCSLPPPCMTRCYRQWKLRRFFFSLDCNLSCYLWWVMLTFWAVIKRGVKWEREKLKNSWRAARKFHRIFFHILKLLDHNRPTLSENLTSLTDFPKHLQLTFATISCCSFLSIYFNYCHYEQLTR